MAVSTKEWNLDAALIACENAAEGARFMDFIDSGWYWDVNPDTLNMSKPRGRCGCVMAQHNDHYNPVEYGLARDDMWTDVKAAKDLGFVSYGGLYEVTYSQLTVAWRDEINNRRAAFFDTPAGKKYADPIPSSFSTLTTV